MEKSVLFIFVLLAIVTIIQAGSFSETSKRKLSEDTSTNIDRSRLLKQLTRQRREDDYYDWQKYLPSKCTNCNILAIGNGYKNTNDVTINGPMPHNWRLN